MAEKEFKINEYLTLKLDKEKERNYNKSLKVRNQGLGISVLVAKAICFVPYWRIIYFPFSIFSKPL